MSHLKFKRASIVEGSERFWKEEVEVIPRLLPGGTEKEHGKPNRVVSVSINIRTENLPITRLEPYRTPSCWISSNTCFSTVQSHLGGSKGFIQCLIIYAVAVNPVNFVAYFISRCKTLNTPQS